MKNRELRQQYRDANPNCELCPIISKLVGFKCTGHKGLECHHGIARGTGGRWDVKSNLVMCCTPAHRWCHENTREGIVAAMAAKLGKGEFDSEELHAAMGQFPMGWLENQIENGGLLEGFALLAEQTLELMKGNDELQLEN